MTGQHRFTTSDGLSLAYHDTGAGLPVLCLAGLTRNSADFEPVVAAFGDAARIIRLDSRGRGASDHDPVIMNYDVRIETRDAIELIDHLELPQVAVIGTSRGGLIAMAMAAIVPDRLCGVALVDVGPELAPEGLAAIMPHVGVAPALPDLDAVAARLAEVNAARFPGVPPAQWRVWAEGGFTETPDGVALRYDPRLRDALLAQAEAGPLPDLWPLFDLLEGLPLALLRGANSDLLTAETAARMQARFPDMILAGIADRGHVPFLDEPASRAALSALLARIHDRTEE
ncbi:alpha/beta hydrolase [Paroceanicella profunda]|uniref:Alpha/beta hydrolase n=1 Tax=Paroceanicella profunda TaxID=2579971 RepID=A0A5B8FH45_9RHOB|nr:alpha/beta hydrolase [Paroceanicella profunda]QDL91598.1 alpha/beta hydrolase [Paroceanicella profunda]